MNSRIRIGVVLALASLAVAAGTVGVSMAVSGSETSVSAKTPLSSDALSRRRAAPSASDALGADVSKSASAETTTRVIVGFTPGGEAAALQSAKGRGAKLVRRAKAGRFAVFEVPAGTDAKGFSAGLAGRPGVSYVEPDAVVRLALSSNDALFSSQWGMARIQAPAAWDVARGADVTVAVVDTGVDLDHPDLVGRIAAGYDVINPATGDANDGQGHGTHVAGIIAATLNNSVGVAGVANLATILPVRVLDDSGVGKISTVAEGIEWAADNGADVINLSLVSSAWTYTMAEAVVYAQQRDCLVVAATGNDNAPSISYPAKLADVLAVGSVGSAGIRSPFSNYGTEIDLVAPGEDIMSTLKDGGYGRKDGTSMATPHVAGVAALVRSAFPTWTASMIQQRLKDSASDLGTPGRDDYYGYGVVQGAAAVGTQSPPPPTVFDDDIPGVEIPGSPVVGMVNEDTDPVDVYSLNVAAGRRLVFALTGPADADFDLELFRPGASGLATDRPIASSYEAASSESISLIAEDAGTYYVAVEAYRGSGGYGLSYADLPALVEPDDDIPGVEPGGAPLMGALDADSDTDDVRWIDLRAGERLSVSLVGSATTDYDAYLYSPAAVSVWAAAPVASAVGIGYPDRFTFVAAYSGRYYLDAYAYQGVGGYTMDYDIAERGPDDDVPGVPVISNPQTGEVDVAADSSDVYAIPAQAGELVDLALTSPGFADFDLHLYGPHLTSVYSAAVVARSEFPSGSVDRISYRAPTSGTYYARVYAYAGSGDYRLHRYLDTALTLASSSLSPSYGSPVTLSAKLTAGGQPLPDNAVVFERANGTGWVAIGSATSAPDGVARISTVPYLNASSMYRARFVEVRGEGPAYHASTTGVTAVVPKALISAPSAPTSVNKGRAFTVSGLLKPRHAKSTYPVRIYKQRYVSGRWVSYGYVSAKAYDHYSYTKYARSISLPYGGRWRLRAYHADASHAATYSGYRYLTVK